MIGAAREQQHKFWIWFHVEPAHARFATRRQCDNKGILPDFRKKKSPRLYLARQASADNDNVRIEHGIFLPTPSTLHIFNLLSIQ